MTTVAMTGATGHIGGNLARALLDQGRKVRALVHGPSSRALDGIAVERVSGDLLDPASLDRAFAGADVVYHLAARISVLRGDDAAVFRTNVDGTRNVVEACRRAGVRRLVHFSSVHALYQYPLASAIDEKRPLADLPDCLHYDRSKARGENVVLEAVKQGLDAVIVNPGAVLGPHDYYPSPMGRVVLDLCKRRLPALIEGGYNWVDVRDVVSGALAAEKRGRTGERYLLTGTSASIADLADHVERASGVRRPRIVTPMWLARLGAPVAESVSRALRQNPRFTSHSLAVLRGNREFSYDKATQELDYRPRPLAETVGDTVSWFRANQFI